MISTFYKGLLATTILAAAPGFVHAKELGNLASISEADGRVEITTQDNERVSLELIKDGILHLRAGADNTLTGAGDKAAKIVVGDTTKPAPYRLSRKDGYHLVQTDHVSLRIYPSPLRFEAYDAQNKAPIWLERKPIDLSAEDSYQTLSSSDDEHFFGGGQQNGQFEFDGKLLEVSYSGGWEEGDRPSPAPFYMSSKGYGVLRNTWADGSYDFRSDGYITARHAENRFDAYYFFGPTIKSVLADYTWLTGRAPLLPRWAFEYGDADCYNDGDNIKKPGTVPAGWSDGPTGTTPDVIASVAAKYREHDMPGGWILPNDGYGCGYTNLPKVVEGLKEYGFRTGLWTENGVDKIAWEVGQAGTRAQKLDVAWTGQGYQFALDANQAAAQGILDNSDSRPFLWTVMGWAGMQRYAVTWTGDQSGSWDYIRWHIPTLIGSGLSGQTYATGDVDGIFGGSPETFTRDLQWKAFTPVLMGMSGWSQNERKHPWWFDEPYRSINRDYLKLKMRLMPYMYSYAWQAEQTGAPIVRGLMWDHPNDPHALTEDYKYQFFLGQDFLVAPVYRSQAASGGWRENIYLPEGDWIDYWDGTVTHAGKDGLEINYPVTLEKLPLLVRAGAIIPMYPEALYDGQVPKDVLTLDIYPHGKSEFDLYEDDGNTRKYKDGAFSRQMIRVEAPKAKAGDIKVTIEPVAGDYDGMLAERAYALMLHTRVKPSGLTLNGKKLDMVLGAEALAQASAGWYYDADDKYGTVHIKLDKVSVRKRLDLVLDTKKGAAFAATKAYPVMPERGTALSPDSVKLLMRPLEEPGHPFENVFDDNPDTWFRSSRDQSLAFGPHEFVLYLGDRKAVSGFDISPRNGQYWVYGQVKDYEIYMADVNGDWRKPVQTGTLALQEGMQSVRFDPVAGRLLRFRILSVHDGNTDPMKADAVSDAKPANIPFNALAPQMVPSVTIGEFRLHEQASPEQAPQKLSLSELRGQAFSNGLGPIEIDHAAGGSVAKDGPGLVMNGLAFTKGLGVFGDSRIDYALKGDWRLFRADVGIDDSCKNTGGMRFQVWGDDRLLYDSGDVAAPAVVKPELDIRGIKALSLRTVDASTPGCGNWANPVLIGYGEKAN